MDRRTLASVGGVVVALCVIRVGVGIAFDSRPTTKEPPPQQSPPLAKASRYPILPANVEWADTTWFSNGEGIYELAILTKGDLIEGFQKEMYELMNDPSESLDKFLIDVKRRYPRLGGARRTIQIADFGRYTVRLDWKAFEPKANALKPCQAQLFVLRNEWDKAPTVFKQELLYGGLQGGLGTMGAGAVSADHRYMVDASSGSNGTTLMIIGAVSTKPTLKMVSGWKAAEFLIRPKKLMYVPGLYEKHAEKFADQSAILLDGFYGALGPNSFFGGAWPPPKKSVHGIVQMGPNGVNVSFGSDRVSVSQLELKRCFGTGLSFPLNVGVQVQGSDIRVRTLQPPVYASDRTSIVAVL